jgi:hypothetical protein
MDRAVLQSMIHSSNLGFHAGNLRLGYCRKRLRKPTVASTCTDCNSDPVQYGAANRIELTTRTVLVMYPAHAMPCHSTNALSFFLTTAPRLKGSRLVCTCMLPPRHPLHYVTETRLLSILTRICQRFACMYIYTKVKSSHSTRSAEQVLSFAAPPCRQQFPIPRPGGCFRFSSSTLGLCCTAPARFVL